MDPVDLESRSSRARRRFTGFPGAFAKRTQELAQVRRRALRRRRGPDLDHAPTTGEELYQRLRELPGFGDAKARIFVGVLGKRLGLGPPGWEAVAADWPSIADVGQWEDVFTLRQQKREMKAAKKGLKVSTPVASGR